MLKEKTCRRCTSGENIFDKVTENENPFKCSKSPPVHLCKLIDLTHAEKVVENKGTPSIEFKEIRRLTRKVYENKKNVDADIKSGEYKIPLNRNQFMRAIKRIHRNLLRDTGVNFNGNFRKDGESVDIDFGPNKFFGCAPQDITPELYELWDKIISPSISKFSQTNPSKKDLAILCGDFLVYFFKIHPFKDGNGRTGRLVCKLILNHFNHDLVIKSGAKATRRYVKALRYSHKKRNRDGLSYFKFSDRRFMNRLVYAYLDKYIYDYSYSPLVDIEPDN